MSIFKERSHLRSSEREIEPGYGFEYQRILSMEITTGSHRCQFKAPGAGCTSVDICLPNCKSCLGRFPHVTSICVLSSNTCICTGWKGELMESETKADINNSRKFDNGFREIACEQILKTDEMVRLIEAGMCKSKSHHFRGGHLNSHKCYLVCRNERFSGGRCRGFGCRCFCNKLY